MNNYTVIEAQREVIQAMKSVLLLTPETQRGLEWYLAMAAALGSEELQPTPAVGIRLDFVGTKGPFVLVDKWVLEEDDLEFSLEKRMYLRMGDYVTSDSMFFTWGPSEFEAFVEIVGVLDFLDSIDQPETAGPTDFMLLLEDESAS